jgi:hypothetical protein
MLDLTIQTKSKGGDRMVFTLTNENTVLVSVIA